MFHVKQYDAIPRKSAWDGVFPRAGGAAAPTASPFFKNHPLFFVLRLKSLRNVLYYIE